MKTDDRNMGGRPRKPVGRDNAKAARIARDVKRLRESQGLSVDKAAARAGVSRETWYRIERAEVKRRTPPKTLERISKALGVTVDELG